MAHVRTVNVHEEVAARRAVALEGERGAIRGDVHIGVIPVDDHRHRVATVHVDAHDVVAIVKVVERRTVRRPPDEAVDVGGKLQDKPLVGSIDVHDVETRLGWSMVERDQGAVR